MDLTGVKHGLKSLVWEDEVAPSKKVAPPQTFATPSNYVPPAATYSGSAMAMVDPEIKATLIQSLNDKKLPGYDYLKFFAALQEMQSMVPAEDARFKMAFITAKQMGVDKAKLADSAQHYLTVLDEDAKEFASHLNDKMQESVTSKEKSLKDLELSIAQRQAEIQKLGQEIQAAQMDYQALGQEVAASRAKLDQKKQAFEGAHQSLANEIQDNIKKINQYL